MSEWIKCSDRLPEDGQCVLVITTNSHSQGDMNIMSVIYEADRSVDYRWGIDHFCESSYAGEVEFWMPLPNPPEIVK